MVATKIAPTGPLRRLAAGTLTSAIGTGAWYTSWALFLTRSVGLRPAQVGVGLTVAGVLGLCAATPAGRLADRVGAREVFAALLLVQAAASLAYVAVGSFAAFLAVACLGELAGRSTGGPRNALVLGLSTAEERMAALGALRSISHVGWAVGALVGAVVIGLDSRAAYVAMLVLNAASFAVYAGLVASVPHVDVPARSGPGVPRRVLRDPPYLTLAGLMGVLALCWAMVSSGLPLWIALHTDAPRSLSAIVVVINSAAVAAFQVRVSRGIESVGAAARGAFLSGGALAVSCVLFALTAGGGGMLVIVVLLAAGAIHVVGELLFVAASWGLSIPLMPPDAPGEYQGVFATGEAAALMAAPILMTTLVADWGQPGWLVLAAIFLVPALAAAPVSRWALATRPAAAQP
jgi:MFS family permease